MLNHKREQNHVFAGQETVRISRTTNPEGEKKRKIGENRGRRWREESERKEPGRVYQVGQPVLRLTEVSQHILVCLDPPRAQPQYICRLYNSWLASILDVRGLKYTNIKRGAWSEAALTWAPSNARFQSRRLL